MLKNIEILNLKDKCRQIVYQHYANLRDQEKQVGIHKKYFIYNAATKELIEKRTFLKNPILNEFYTLDIIDTDIERMCNACISHNKDKSYVDVYREFVNYYKADFANIHIVKYIFDDETIKIIDYFSYAVKELVWKLLERKLGQLGCKSGTIYCIVEMVKTFDIFDVKYTNAKVTILEELISPVKVYADKEIVAELEQELDNLGIEKYIIAKSIWSVLFFSTEDSHLYQLAGKLKSCYSIDIKDVAHLVWNGIFDKVTEQERAEIINCHQQQFSFL